MNSLWQVGKTLCGVLLCWIVSSCSCSVSKENAFVAAAARGDIQTMQQLLSSGVSVNCRSTALPGDTPLTTAVWGRNAEAVDFLLQAGAGPDLRNSQGLSPLQIALESPGDQSAIIVGRLVRAGADAESVSEVVRALGINNANRGAFEDAVEQMRRAGRKAPGKP